MSLSSPPLRLFAAGNLRAALTEIVAPSAGKIDAPNLVFGPAGLPRERIEAGDVPDIFLSANMEHPAALAAARTGFLPPSPVRPPQPEIGLNA